MKIIISIVVVMFYAVIGCFISEMVYEEYDPSYILFWPIVIACFIPIWITSGILEGFGWLRRRLRKRKSVYAHIDQNIENKRSNLNPRTEKTKKVMHLMVTSLCDRDCKYCCNKQYYLNSIPYATDEELREVETLCLTGGEPFAYTKPNAIAYHYKHKYSNIMRVIVYTNAYELWSSLIINRAPLGNIDGLNISIKNLGDYLVLDDIIRDKEVCSLPLNRIYVFGDRLYEKTNSLLTEYDKLGRFRVIRREWQEDFKPADDSIFRRV